MHWRAVNEPRSAMEPAGKGFAARSGSLNPCGCRMNNIAKLFQIDTENSELMGAQLAAFSRQVPLLYFILSVNSIALAFTHLGLAPVSLTVAFPGFSGRRLCDPLSDLAAAP